jgi:hypothetical protein
MQVDERKSILMLIIKFSEDCVSKELLSSNKLIEIFKIDDCSVING